MEMRLMKRDRHSLEPQPVRRNSGSAKASPRQLMHLSEEVERHVFSKLLLCSPEEVARLILSNEKAELEAQFEAEKDCPESCFIQQALEQLAVRESNFISSISVEQVTFILYFILARASY